MIMNKITYLKRVLGDTSDTPLWMVRAWYIMMFGILDTTEPSNILGKDKYMGGMTDDGFKFINDSNELELLEDTKPGKPLFMSSDVVPVNLYKGAIDKSAGDTTILGNMLSNMICVYYPFKDKIPFQYKKWSFKGLENDFISRGMLKDDKDKTAISVKDYKNYVISVSFIKGLSFLFVRSSTRKTITSSPEVTKLRNKLLKEHKDELDDYTVIADIENQLRALDDEYLKDDPTNGVFMSGKIKNIARKRMFGIYGAEDDHNNPGKAVLITQSLEEGLPKDPEKLVAAFNGVRMGSFMRGSETQKGGVAAKELLRVLNAFSVKPGDCSTKGYIEYTINKKDINLLVGLYHFTTTGSEVLTSDYIEKNDGKTIKLRSPLYCFEKGTHFCTHCAGDKLAMKENEIAIGAMDTSHVILTSSLKAMHGTVLSTIDVDLNDLVS